MYKVISFSPGVCQKKWVRINNRQGRKKAKKKAKYSQETFWYAKLYTVFVVTMMMLIGRVKNRARPADKRSAHHGSWTWSFMKMQSTRESSSDSARCRTTSLGCPCIVSSFLSECLIFLCLKLWIFYISPCSMNSLNEEAIRTKEKMQNSLYIFVFYCLTSANNQNKIQ